MAADPWRATPYLKYRLGVLMQKWVRDCWEYREYGGVERRCTWVEEEWRGIPCDESPPTVEPKP